MAPTLTHVNPAGLPRNPAFSQAVVVEGASRTIHVAGQNAFRPDGSVVEDVRDQTRAALRNLELVLDAAGARLEDVVSWSILIVAGQPLAAAFAAFQEIWAARGEPPAISVAVVSGLANPRSLVEIGAIAVA